MADPEDTDTCARQRAAFEVQRRSAKRRGIPFLFSFEEWQAWWVEDGRWPERGRGRDKLCMARFGDAGPYSWDNVYCTTHAGNGLDVPSVVRRTARQRGSAAACLCHHRREG